MDHEADADNVRYVSITDEMGDSIAQTSERMHDLAVSEAYRQLPANTSIDRAYVWTLCCCSAALARCLLKDKTAAGTNLVIANDYIKKILHKVL